MKILFFTSPIEDYLADALLHGFKELYGNDCVDYPKCEILYKNCSQIMKSQVRGNGFSLYSGLIEDLEVDRFNVFEKVKKGYYDFVVFGNIQRQFGYFTHCRPWLNPKNTIILDGDDTDKPYPANGFWWRKPYYWSLPVAHKNFLYFKREITPNTRFSVLYKAVPQPIKERLSSHKNIRSISFSFPEEKIIQKLPVKQKLFPAHIVDTEVARHIADTQSSYVFTSEKDYYNDLQISKYGITIKRAGWDCLRHYELAANGCVICFRDLDNKPELCAPHGLGVRNTIIYSNYNDLMEKVHRVSTEEYESLQHHGLHWIKEHTTVKAAKRVLEHFI